MGVFGQHARVLFFTDLADLPQSSLGLKLFYFCTGVAPQLVMVFFVLSGYLIASSVLRDIQRRQWSWSKYLANRFTRLYVVLLPALLLTLLWDGLGVYREGARQYPGLNGLNLEPDDISTRLTATSFLGNALFLQNVYVDPFGSNSPLWSLSNEFWYYLIFPLACLLLYPKYSLINKLICMLAAIVIAIAFWPLMILFPIWLFGAALALLPKAKFLEAAGARTAILLISAFGFIAALVASRIHSIPPVLIDYCVGLTFAVIVYGLLHLPQKHSGRWYSFLSSGLAGMSYTLYLAHLPILVFLRVIINPNERWQPTVGTMLWFALILLGVFLYSFVLSRITEANTSLFRNLFRTRPAPELQT